MRCVSMFVGLVVMAVLLGPSRADNWPQWRGLNNDGISQERNLPTTWDAHTNVLWTFPLPGTGGSTPAVWGEHIFLTSEDGRDLVGLCVSTAGKELWRVKLGAGNGRARADEGNGASPSPSTDGKHVWFFVGSG